MSSNAFCQAGKVVSVMYFNNNFGNIHHNASAYSSVVTTISCNHPVKVLGNSSSSWTKVQVANQVGYLPSKNLSPKRVDCFQDKYPRFFDQFNVTPTDVYLWGVLTDMMISGKARVK